MLWLRHLASYRGMLLVTGLCVLYILSPVDVVPDFIPFLGRLDDLGALVGTYWLVRRLQVFLAMARPHFSQTHQRQDASGHTHQQAASDSSGATAFDPWNVLQIPRGASQADIQTAYKTLLKKYHPDRVVHLGEEFQELAHQKMLRIQKAYGMLKQQARAR